MLSELARVLKRSGRLGIVALSPYRDQVIDEAGAKLIQQPQGFGQIRPAAAYRAVLGEAGFTAFLFEDRRRELRRSAQAIYRQHMLEPTAPTTAAVELLAAGGVSMTLITAEKGSVSSPQNQELSTNISTIQDSFDEMSLELWICCG